MSSNMLEHILSIMDVELGSSPPLHNAASTLHSTDEERLTADGVEELAAQDTDEGQYAADVGEEPPLPDTVPHGILAT